MTSPTHRLLAPLRSARARFRRFADHTTMGPTQTVFMSGNMQPNLRDRPHRP